MTELLSISVIALIVTFAALYFFAAWYIYLTKENDED